MTNQQIELTCAWCKHRHQVNSMRYDKEGRDLVCKECYENRYNRDKLKGLGEERLSRQISNKISEMKIKYRCNICKQNFAIKNRPDITKRCPFCGRSNIIPQDTMLNADELIEESMKPEYDF